MSVPPCIDKLIPTPAEPKRRSLLAALWCKLVAAFRPPPKPPSIAPGSWLERADARRLERRRELEAMERGPLPPWLKPRK